MKIKTINTALLLATILCCPMCTKNQPRENSRPALTSSESKSEGKYLLKRVSYQTGFDTTKIGEAFVTRDSLIISVDGMFVAKDSIVATDTLYTRNRMVVKLRDNRSFCVFSKADSLFIYEDCSEDNSIFLFVKAR